MVRNGVAARQHHSYDVGPLRRQRAFHEEGCLDASRVESVENRRSVIGWTVIDRQADFIRVRFEMSDDGSQPLRVRPAGRVDRLTFDHADDGHVGGGDALLHPGNQVVQALLDVALPVDEEDGVLRGVLP